MTTKEERAGCTQSAQGKEAEHRPDVPDQGDAGLGAGLHAESDNTYGVLAEVLGDPEKLRTLCHRYVDAAVDAAGRPSECGTQTEDAEQAETETVETEDEPTDETEDEPTEPFGDVVDRWSETAGVCRAFAMGILPLLDELAQHGGEPIENLATPAFEIHRVLIERIQELDREIAEVAVYLPDAVRTVPVPVVEDED